MVFDPGTGLFLPILLLFFAAYGQRLIYLPAVPVIVMLRIIQIGGYIPDRSSGQAAPKKSSRIVFH